MKSFKNLGYKLLCLGRRKRKLNLQIINPLDAVYRCDSCSKCCEDGILISPAEAMDLSLATGIPVADLVIKYNRYQAFIINPRENDQCRFLEDGRCTIYNLKERPTICRSFPLKLDFGFKEGNVQVTVKNIEGDGPCIGKGQTRRVMKAEDVAEIADRTLRIIASQILTSPTLDVDSTCSQAHSFYEKMSIEHAVSTIINNA